MIGSQILRLIAIGTVLTVVALKPASSNAQLNPYSRFTDPLGIARLDDSLRSPIHCTTHNYIPTETDADGYQILAKVEGKSIISHIWFVHNAPDDTCRIKLWVDDSLLVSCTIREFVTESHGLLRPPLCRPSSGSSICDVQIPCQHRFKLTYQQGVPALFWYAVEWRALGGDIILPKLGSSLLEQQQIEAEKLYTLGNIWEGASHDSIGFYHVFRPHDTLVIADIEGPGCIQQILASPSLLDMDSMDSLILEIHWDNDPHPAVHVSLGALFGALTWPRQTTSAVFDVDAPNQLRTLCAMPFAHHAVIRLIDIRDGDFYINASGNVLFDHRPVDPTQTGYFHTETHRSNPTRYHVWHPVLHTRGDGNYVGTILQIPTISAPAALEGDPRFLVDSDASISYRLTGTEDYFNGGNYFDGSFTDPFGGLIAWPTSMYRFHILDAIPFRTSIDIDLQHGFNTDVKEDYHTTALYYSRWIPYWTNRDTLAPHDLLMVQGSGYQAAAGINIEIDGMTLQTTTATANGSFEWSGRVPTTLAPGWHDLRVNGTSYPNGIYTITNPTIRPLVDTLPIVLEVGDTLAFTAVGFAVGEPCRIHLDSFEVASIKPIEVGSDGRLFAAFAIPVVAAGYHRLWLLGDRDDTAFCSLPIRSTAIRDYEFERLLQQSTASNESAKQLVVSNRWFYRWGEQAVVEFRPTTVGDSIAFRFWVPQTDSFQVFVGSTLGQSYANFNYSLDGRSIGTFNGFAREPLGVPIPSDSIRLGLVLLDSGFHSCSFRYAGHDSRSTDSVMELDRLLLIPTHGENGDTSLRVLRSKTNVVSVFPNPVSGSKIVHFRLPSEDTSLRDGAARIVIFDALGRSVASTFSDWQGDASTISVPIPSLQPGSYTAQLDIYSNSGLRDLTASFIVLQ